MNPTTTTQTRRSMRSSLWKLTQVRAPKWTIAVLLLFLMTRTFAQVDVTASGGTIPSASYLTLKEAFDSINSGAHQGVITIGISANTSEAASAVLNESGGTASYSAITISPTGGGARTITGAITDGPLVDLNGADNVTIDGLNTGGNSLTISNTGVGATASTIRFIADASTNVVNNTTVTGSTTGLGVVFFSTGTVTGNYGNKISNCNITAAGSNYPLNGVYSLGTSDLIDNSNDSLDNNNISDYYSAASATSGIQLVATNAGNSEWVITNNKLFQSETRLYTTANIHNGINIGSGSGYTITGNTIGFANASGTGTTNLVGSSAIPAGFPALYSVAGTPNATRYIAINCAFTAGGAVSSVQNNTIGGFALYTSSNASTFNGIWCGINITSGNADIGTTSGNTIGSTSDRGSIYTACTVTGGAVVGIYATSGNTVNIQNNSIGGINASGTIPTTAGGFVGIDVAGAGDFSIKYNTLGNELDSNIRIGYFTDGGLSNTGLATSTTGTAALMGIRSAATGNTLSIISNTFRGMQVSSTLATVTGINSLGAMTGTDPSVSIDTNSLGTSAQNWVIYVFPNGGVLTGIALSNTVATTHTIRANDIRGITYSVSGTGGHTYINLTGATAADNVSTISNNTFTNLSVGSSGAITFISHNYAIAATGTLTIDGNAIVTAFNRTVVSGSAVIISNTFTASVAGATCIYTNNNFSDITLFGGAGALTGFSGSGAVARTVTGNVFSNWNHQGTGTVIGVNLTAWGAGISDVSNNTVQDITGGSAISAFVLGASGTGTSLTASLNQVYNINGTGASGNLTGISIGNIATTMNVHNNSIRVLKANGASATAVGMVVTGATNTGFITNVWQNAVDSLIGSGATAPTVWGIQVNGGADVRIYRNKIHTLSATAAVANFAVTGLVFTGATTITAYNNLIGNLTAPAGNGPDIIRGIDIRSIGVGRTYNIYNNTVYINASSTGLNFGTTGIFHGSHIDPTNGTLNLRNNIIVNTSTANGTGFTVAFRRSAGVANQLNNYGSASNNNLFYAGTPGASNLIYFDGVSSAETIGDYKGGAFTAGTIAPRDASSVSESVTFLSTDPESPNFLHVDGSIASQTESGGEEIDVVADDYDGDARGPYPLTGEVNGGGIAPDIGADEFDGKFLDLNAPVISYSALSDTTVSASRVLIATITDLSKVDSTANKPRVYFKKSTNADAFGTNDNTFNGWKWVEATNTGSPFSFTMDYTLLTGGGVSAGTVIQYFVAAQDLVSPTPNVGASPAAGFEGTSVSAVLSAPTTPGQFAVYGSWSGDYTIGGTAMGPDSINGYVTLSEAFADTKVGVVRSIYITDGGDGYSSTPTVQFTGGGGSGAAATATITGGVVTQIKMTNYGTGYTSAPTIDFIGGTPVTPATATANLSTSRALSSATVLEFGAGYNPDLEDGFPINVIAITNASSDNTLTIRPALGVTTTITGSSASPLINLDGANYVIIDGRAGGTGSTNALTIENTSTAATASTIRFINEASNDTIKYCDIKGASTTNSTGTVVFGTTTGSNGNDNNVLDYCNIYDASTGTPQHAINAVGSTTNAATFNDNCTVSNCNIYNFFTTAGGGSRGLNIGVGNSGWTVTGNSFYQTATRSGSTSVVQFLSATPSNNTVGFTITNNYFGGTEPHAEGGMCTFTAGSAASELRSIIFVTAAAVPNSFQGNVFKNISFSSAYAGGNAQCLLQTNVANMNIGTESPNYFGDSTDAGSITVSVNGANFSAMVVGFGGAGTFNIQNNIISGITMTGATGACRGISVGNAGNFALTATISGNQIGSITNSVGLTSNTNGAVQGIFYNANSSTALQTITNNRITNLTSTGGGSANTVIGISCTTTTCSYNISGNSISNLSTNSTATANTVIGIHYAATAAGATVSQNKIYNLSSTATSAASQVMGILYAGPTTGSNIISKNRIYACSFASGLATANLYGLRQTAGSNTTVHNNEISLGADANNSFIANGIIYGIYEQTGANRYYYNSVRLVGSDVANTAASYAFYTALTGGTREYINNSFSNERSYAVASSSQTIKNIAAYYAGVPSAGALSGATINNNLYYAPGTDGVLIVNNTNVNYLTLPEWTAVATAHDANSVSADPMYNSYTSLLPFDSTGLMQGATVSVTDDIDGTLRTLPLMGAYETTGDISAPMIASDKLTNTTLLTNRSVSIAISDHSSVDTTANAPRVYYKKSTDDNVFGGNTSADNGWKWVATTSTSSPFSFTIDYSILTGGSVVSGDVIQYFVVAQDLAGTPHVGASTPVGFAGTSVSVISAAPTSPNSYTILPILSSPLNVGTGETYTSLTGNGGLFEAINGAALGGNTVVNITSDLTETGVHQLNPTGLAGFTLTIQPVEDEVKVISGANLGAAMVRLYGVSGITIDGRFAGSGRYLRFVNTNTATGSGTAVIGIDNSASDITLRNCVIESNSSSTGTGNVLVGNASNITLLQNTLRNAVGTPGTAGVPHSLLRFNSSSATRIFIGSTDPADSNSFVNFTASAIVANNLAVGDSVIVLNNNFYQTGARTGTLVNIALGGGNGHNISNNHFFQQSGAITGTYSAINITTTSGSGHTISGNTIGGSDTEMAGASLSAQAGSNIITLTAAAGGSLSTIQSNQIGNISIAGGSVASKMLNMTAGNVMVSSNTIGGTLIAPQTITVANNDIHAMSYSGVNSITIDNNLIGNMDHTTVAAAATVGIIVTGGTPKITNNTIHDISTTSTGSGSFVFGGGNAQWTYGIGVGNSTTPILDTIANNTIYNISRNNVLSGTYNMAGIAIQNATAGSLIQANRVYGFSNATVGSASMWGIYAHSGSASYVNNQISFPSPASGAVMTLLVRGIEVNAPASTTNSFYYNSVSIGGSMTSALSTYAFFRNGTGSNTLAVSNNIFYNRVTGLGNHYAIGSNSANVTGFTNTNNLFVDSLPTAKIAMIPISNPVSLDTWNTETGGSANLADSTKLLTVADLFPNASTGDLSTTHCRVSNAGVALGDVTTDYAGTTRDGSTPDIGSVEFGSATGYPAVTVQPAATTTVCAGASVSTISVTATGSGLAYRWQVNDGSGWVNIGEDTAVYTGSGSEALTITNPDAAYSGMQYRVVVSGVCSPADTSDADTLTVTPAVTSNTISGDQTICSGSAPNMLTGSTPVGGDGSYTYSWLVSTTSATAGFSAIPSTNAVDYTPGSLTQNTWYRRVVTSGTCAFDTSAAIEITINQPVADNTATGTQTICSGSSPSALTGSTPTGGDGVTYTYAWLASTSSATSGFAAAGGTDNTQNYAPGVLTQNTWYKRVVTSGACANDTSAAVAVTVTPAIAANTLSSDQTIVSGTSAATITGSGPSGGTGTYAYSWLVSTTSATAGFSAIPSSNTQDYAPGTLSQNTWYRRLVISGSCSDTSAATEINVVPAITLNTVTGAQTICSASAAASLTGSAPSGGTGTYTYTWLISTTSATTGFSAIPSSNTQNYAPGTLSQNTWYRRYVVSGPAADTSVAVLVTVNQPIATNSITGSAQTICSGSVPNSITASVATGGDGSTYTYEWLSSTTSATTGFAAATGTNNTVNYSPATLTQTTWYKRVVTSGTCAKDTTSAVQITVNAAGTWTGATSSAWNNTANWSCPLVPTSATNVIIPSTDVTNMPVVTDAQQVANLTIQSGATLTLNASASQLSIFGTITNNGTFSNTNGKVVLSGSATQTVPAGTYAKLQINNAANVNLGGAVILTDSLILVNGKLNLGANNLTLGNASYASSGTATSYVATNGTGSVTVQNVGSTGKTAAVVLPVGNSTFNPAVLTNTGTTDSYTVSVIDSITETYSGSTPTGLKLTSDVVNRTWIINEGVAGGSNATVTLQWAGTDELSGFIRSSSYIGRHNGTNWASSAASSASGSDPYTQTLTGVTSFSPFGVGSGSALPVEMLSFTAAKHNETVTLNWVTASEVNNDHFVVQRSVDGVVFENIGMVKGRGTTSMVSNYSYIDASAASLGVSVVYYRLQQVDYDSRSAHSKVVTVDMGATTSAMQVSVSPNPFTDYTSVSVNATVASRSTLKVTDIQGRLVFEKPIELEAGMNTVLIDELAASAYSGIYFVSIVTPTESIVTRIVKAK